MQDGGEPILGRGPDSEGRFQDIFRWDWCLSLITLSIEKKKTVGLSCDCQ